MRDASQAALMQQRGIRDGCRRVHPGYACFVGCAVRTEPWCARRTLQALNLAWPRISQAMSGSLRIARSAGFLVGLLCSTLVTAALLDDALDLVVNQNAAINARQAEARALAKQSSWTSEVRVGYHAQGTLEQAGSLPAAAEACTFTRDQLDYVRRAVDEGREEADALWPVAANLRQAQQTLTESKQRYCVQLETLARTYGGERWTTLRDLLAAHARVRTPSMSSAVAPTCW